MADTTGIQWTDATWNPVTGCTKVSPGCAHCYAEGFAFRGLGRFGHKYAVPSESQPGVMRRRRFEEVQCHDDALDLPLRWQKPRRIFVNSMSDLFHQDVPWSFIERVFDVMQQASAHTFQVLTKRADNMRMFAENWAFHHGGPLPNVWLGVSGENDRFLSERMKHLARTPNALPWVSLEPLLEDVSHELATWLRAGALRWVVVGGESGTRARPFAIEWPRTIVPLCWTAGVACFVKQLGANPTWGGKPIGYYEGYDLHDSHGGDPDEWPTDLRIREYPAVASR